MDQSLWVWIEGLVWRVEGWGGGVFLFTPKKGYWNSCVNALLCKDSHSWRRQLNLLLSRIFLSWHWIPFLWMCSKLAYFSMVHSNRLFCILEVLPPLPPAASLPSITDSVLLLLSSCHVECAFKYRRPSLLLQNKVLAARVNLDCIRNHTGCVSASLCR